MSDKPKLYDVELSIRPHQCGPQCKKAAAEHGPAKVNSEAFQSEW